MVQPALAQSPSSSAASAGPSCIDAIPASALQRAPVYLTANTIDSAESRATLQQSIDPFTQSVAQRARTLPTASEGVLPEGEPAISWRSLECDVRVVARRGGGISWMVQPPTHPNDIRANDVGAQLVGRGLDSLTRHGDGLVIPDSIAADSAAWLLPLEPAIIDEHGEIRTPRMRMGIPVFSVRLPPQRAVRGEWVRVRYPRELRDAGFMGHVTMEFVADTAGRPVPASIRDLLPAKHAPLDEPLRRAYATFVRRISLALESAR